MALFVAVLVFVSGKRIKDYTIEKIILGWLGSGTALASGRRRRRGLRVRKIMCVAGARPNFMKVGPIMHAMRGVQPVLVHTGQHYDAGMNEVFFAELQIPRPDRFLNVGSGSHAVQTAQVMLAIEPVIEEARPDLVVVVGDVNSTLAAALVAAKLGVAGAHVEAGLRSFDRSMPEEINRVLTDQIAALLFITEHSAPTNLAREGIAAERVHFVGNVMIDSLRACLPREGPGANYPGRRSEAAPGFALLRLGNLRGGSFRTIPR